MSYRNSRFAEIIFCKLAFTPNFDKIILCKFRKIVIHIKSTD